jgi:hypothetical protein
MEDRTAVWSERVSEWRASGKSSTSFCKGKSFTAGGLRYWASRLKGAPPGQLSSKPEVRLARVLRTSAPVRDEERARVPLAAASAIASEPTLVVEVHGARVSVRPGFDRSTLAAVLDVLATQGGR